MTNQNKSVEEVAGEIWRCIKKDFENEGLQLPDNWKGIGMAYGGYTRACEIIQQERQTSQEREREKEAYLWFENWYSHYKAPLTAESNQDFGKWATERLQTLGVHEPENLTNPNKD